LTEWAINKGMKKYRNDNPLKKEQNFFEDKQKMEIDEVDSEI